MEYLEVSFSFGSALDNQGAVRVLGSQEQSAQILETRHTSEARLALEAAERFDLPMARGIASLQLGSDATASDRRKQS